MYFAAHARWISLGVVVETLLVWSGLGLAAYLVQQQAIVGWLIPVFLLGIWLNRCYLVGHEAVHRKLFPENSILNDVIGTVILFPLLAPLTIYRHIHQFHHAYNRQSPEMAALDTFISDRPLTFWRRRYYQILWLSCVFLGGFFLHSLVSIVLFLVLPTHLGEQLSPAFRGWNGSKRLRAWVELTLGIGFHVSLVQGGGVEFWSLTCGAPLLVFAWVWSMLLYIYHYDTTVGKPVIYNVRSLPPQPVLSWLLLNFNEHSTHHANPQIPWYRLPQERLTLPEAFQSNQQVTTLWQAIGQQWRGPRIVLRSEITE